MTLVARVAAVRRRTALAAERHRPVRALRRQQGRRSSRPSEIVASSTSGTANEPVELIAAAGRQLPDLAARLRRSPARRASTLTVNAIQGNDLTVTGVPPGAVPAGTPVTLHVTYNKAMTAGQSYFGELLLGPKSAPSAFTVPVQINRTP